ncbi:hypothetical protein ABK040_008092 [Willaertia magna]
MSHTKNLANCCLLRVKNNKFFFQHSLSQKPFRNFYTNLLYSSSFNTFNNLSIIENHINQFTKEIRELDQQIKDKETIIQKENDFADKVMLHIEKFSYPIQDSFPLEMKRLHFMTQCMFRGITMRYPTDNGLNNFLQQINLNCSERIKNVMEIRNGEMKGSQVSNQVEADWFLKFLKEEFDNDKYISDEFNFINRNTKGIMAHFDNLLLILQHYFTTESKELQIIIGFYLITFYLTGIDFFGNIVQNRECIKMKDGHLTTFSKLLNETLNKYNMWKDDLDMSYKIKDFELLDKDITLQTCVDCLQFLNLLLQSNGNEQSIQQIMDNYYEKQKDNYIFSFIYSIFLYNLNRKQEANIILKQLTLLVNENKTIQITALPIANWFLATSIQLNNNNEEEDIESLKLACIEMVKYEPKMVLYPLNNTLFNLVTGFYILKNYVPVFNISLTILNEIPYLYSEEKLLYVLRTFFNSGINLLEEKYKYVSTSLLSTFNRYAICFPSNVEIQMTNLICKENFGVMKDKKELLREYTRLYEMCCVPTEEMKKHEMDTKLLDKPKQFIYTKLMELLK